LIGKAIVLLTPPEPKVPNSVPAQQTIIKWPPTKKSQKNS
jgi:hypothetical protein